MANNTILERREVDTCSIQPRSLRSAAIKASKAKLAEEIKRNRTLEQMAQDLEQEVMYCETRNAAAAEASTANNLGIVTSDQGAESAASGDGKGINGCQICGTSSPGCGICDNCKEGNDVPGKNRVVLRSSSRKRSSLQQPVTPRLEEPRAVRANRGMKRRFPGDESDDNCARKRTRVRSIAKVCGPTQHNSPTAESACKGAIYVCNVEGCEKSFSDAVALYNHGRVHGDRPYVCHYDNCTKRFSERSKLKRHFLIHTGEKPFICLYEGCGKAFSLDFNLRSHMKTHTGEYHECPHTGCEKRYCQEYKLRAHICKEHKGSSRTVDTGGSLSNNSMFIPNDKVAKKKARVELLISKRVKLEKWKEGRKKRMHELELELEVETKELAKIEKAIRKLSREQELVELEEYTEQDFASDHTGEEELGEVYGDEKEVVMLAHKLPTADQGARLMDQVILIQGTPPLSPSMSVCPQPFVLSRLRLEVASNSANGLQDHRGNQQIPFLPSNLCMPSATATSNCLFEKYDKEKQECWLQSEDGRSCGGTYGLGRIFPPKDVSVSSFMSVLAEQVSQSEPPVSQLFTCQEQPCLAD